MHLKPIEKWLVDNFSPTMRNRWVAFWRLYRMARNRPAEHKGPRSGEQRAHMPKQDANSCVIGLYDLIPDAWVDLVTRSDNDPLLTRRHYPLPWRRKLLQADIHRRLRLEGNGVRA